MPSEIVIADDGSHSETKQVISDIAAMAPIPIIHVWQPDEGFRLARIRNKAISKARGEYIICIDGDILLDKNFVHDHLRFARRGRFIAGTRTDLMPAATQK
jgi:glycosyltransferase involved in cell wall biosynthesis